MKETIGTISSVVLTQSDTGETGTYSIPIEIDFSFVVNGGGADYVRHEIARHLAGCAANTGIPMNEAAWVVSIDERFANMFNLLREFRA